MRTALNQVATLESETSEMVGRAGFEPATNWLKAKNF
jgi:hypothetical protein